MDGDCAVELHDDAGRSLACVSVSDPSDLQVRTREPISETLARRLSPLIERLPSLIEGGSRLFEQETTFRLVLKPEFRRGLLDGSLDLMKSKEVAGGYRLNVVVGTPGPWGGKAGTVVGQGSVVPVSASKVAVVASVGFQLATYAVGQVHLRDINELLRKVQDVIHDVLDHLETDEGGRLRAWAKRLAEASVQLQRGTLDVDALADLKGEFRSISDRADEVAEALWLRLGTPERRIETARADGPWWAPLNEAESDRKKRARVEGHARRLLSLHDRLQQALWVRLAATELLLLLSDDPVLPDRLKDVERRVGEARSRLETVLSASLPSYEDYRLKRELNGLYGNDVHPELGRPLFPFPKVPERVSLELLPHKPSRDEEVGPHVAQTLYGWYALKWTVEESQERVERLRRQSARDIEVEVLRRPDGSVEGRLLTL